MQSAHYSRVQEAIHSFGMEGFLSRMSQETLGLLAYQWELWARPNQLPPAGLWRFWLIQAGRGAGKTRSGAEFCRDQARRYPGSHGALIAETPAQARDVMVLGESGILACCPEKERPIYKKTERLLVWPLVTGQPSTAHLYSAHNFEELRGPQHHWAWADELGKWRYATDAFDQLNLGLRLGEHPRCVITTTPRPISVLRKLRKDPRCVITTGSTYDNAVNLATDFLDDVRARYEGTRLGRQELAGELLEDTPGALWKRVTMIDAHRRASYPVCLDANGKPRLTRGGVAMPDLDVIVVGVDPSVADVDDEEREEGQTDLCGITVAGRKGHGTSARYYLLEDASIYGSPDTWAKAVVAAYRRWDADLVVAEENNGGKLVEMAIKQIGAVKYKGVHASRGKQTRAEPISLLYEQGRAHHVGHWDALEDEMCMFVPGITKKSPDRMDAMVWAMTELSEIDSAKERSRMLVG